MKNFNGKAIYQPAGKAAEYSKWACNFYVGCSNGCEYCYLKHGRGAAVLGGCEPKLKKCFRNELHAWEVFMNEVCLNLSELKQHGLFFSFTTDPLLPETKNLTIDAIDFCVLHNIPVKILTKCTVWLEPFLQMVEDNVHVYNKKSLFAFGFTLTGHDELEKGAATNDDRIRAMKVLNAEGFKTFASIEPVINFADSLTMIEQVAPYCDLFKIGLKSGDKHHFESVREFIENVVEIVPETPIYFKDSLLKQAGIKRDDITRPENFVGSDYNMFSQNIKLQ